MREKEVKGGESKDGKGRSEWNRTNKRKKGRIEWNGISEGRKKEGKGRK